MATFFLCIKIFFVRILDVSLGTIRTIVTVKNKKLEASIIGFFEVLVWFIIVKEALNTDNTSILIAVSYSLGFASGTYIGTYLSNKYIKGNIGIQVITSNRNKKLIDLIRNEGFAVSVLNVRGHDSTKRRYMLFIEIDKNKFERLRKIIKCVDPKAFVVVNETKNVYNGYFNK